MASQKIDRQEKTIKSSKESIEQLDKIEIARYLRQGWTFAMISAKLGRYTPAKIKEIVIGILDDASKTYIENAEAVRAMKLEELAEIKVQGWSAFHKSLGNHKKITNETITSSGGMGDSTRTKKSRTISQMPGDPRFLQVIKSCIDTETDLLGLKAPKNVNVNGTMTLFDILSNVPGLSIPDNMDKLMIQHLNETKLDTEISGIDPSETINIDPTNTESVKEYLNKIEEEQVEQQQVELHPDVKAEQPLPKKRGRKPKIKTL